MPIDVVRAVRIRRCCHVVPSSYGSIYGDVANLCVHVPVPSIPAAMNTSCVNIYIDCLVRRVVMLLCTPPLA